MKSMHVIITALLALPAANATARELWTSEQAGAW
jgi:hypothetical protein